MTEHEQSILDPDAPITRREFEARMEAIKNTQPRHDMTYKGHDYWNAVRENVRRILRDRPATYIDIQDDPWMRRESHAQSSEQWRRIRNVLIQGHPHRNGCPYPRWRDGVEFVDYFVRGRGRPVIYLSLRENLPCDVETALRAEHVSRARYGQLLRRIRDRYPLDQRICRCSLPGLEHVPISGSKLDDSGGPPHRDGPPNGEVVSVQNSTSVPR